ncbi:hypothetical protein T07_11965 [Trichinella nelsoni]|uniref:Uncharacterized protein n=1 Tax=Trichinella nelsoni TaxID=6336 RepID=A0A0V0RUP1_9BILA|nr:hypothetical protein T07_11965 [Trichinella nelsoni]
MQKRIQELMERRKRKLKRKMVRRWMSMRRWLRKRIFIDLSQRDSNTTIINNNNKLQPTHLRYSPFPFKYTSAYGSFILLPLRRLDKRSCSLSPCPLYNFRTTLANAP